MPRPGGDSRRLPPTENDDAASTDYEMDSDDSAFIEAADEIESAHTSPVKTNPPTRLGASPPRSASRAGQQPRRARAEANQTRNGASSRASNREPQTPHRHLHNSTPASRRTAATASLSRMTLSSASADSDDNMDGVARRLFHPSASATTPVQNHGTIIISDTEEEDQDISEVSNMLTDTEDSDEAPRLPRNTQNSMSSTGVTPLFARVSTDESFTSINSGGSTSFQSNRAAVRVVGQSSAQYSPSRSPTKGARPSSVRRRKEIRDALESPMPAPATPKAGTAASSSSTTRPMTRQSRHSTDHSTPRARAPIRVGRDSPRPAAVASSSTAALTMQAPKAGPSPALLDFVKQDIGGNLTLHEICHNTDVQPLLDQANIAWGVQYELARGILEKRWKWTDVARNIDNLRGSNTDVAARVPYIMGNRTLPGDMDNSLWQELDREQEAIVKNQGRGLGCLGEWMGANPWWGGRIQQLARLDYRKEDKKLKIDVILEPMEQRRCHRLARYLGSRRVLQLRVAQELVMSHNEQLLEFLSQKFVICGRVFMPFSSKDNGVYLVEVDEDHDRQPCAEMGDQFRQGLKETIRWANSLEDNFAQPISKWSARFALALSNSVPVLEFDEDKIFHIDDDYSPSYNHIGKASAEQIVTDGCGFMNGAALRRIQSFLGLTFRPTAVQGRIKGAKGVWTLHPDNDDLEPMIWLRKSQIKVELKAPLHRSQRIFDFLAYSKPSSSVSLSSQTIINLHFNGVPAQTLIKLMEKGLRDAAEPLMKWEGPYANQMLMDAVSKIGGIHKARAVRVAGALSRAIGLEKRDWGGGDDVKMKGPEETAVDAADVDDAFRANSSGRKPYSDEPLSLHEKAYDLLEAGFKPQEFAFLKDKLRYIMRTYITSMVEDYSIPLSLAVNNYIIPDPYGVLEKDEIYYRSSTSVIDPLTQTAFNVFTGPVLIGRYPVRLPSDIQKFTAVDRPELAQYPDVLIVSTKGSVSIASLLSGGDYDGDECFVIADPEIVEPFRSKPLCEPPPDLMADFEKDVTLIEDFITKVAADSQPSDKTFIKQLLLGLHDSKKGLYSTFHDMAVWKYGYDHKRAIKLAYKFNTLLDSGKTGHRLIAGVFEKDRGLFGGKVPTLEELEQGSTKRSVLHELSYAGHNISDSLLKAFDKVPSPNNSDDDLLQPWRNTREQIRKAPPEKASLLRQERDLLDKNTIRVYEAWKIARSQLKRADSGPAKKKRRTDKATGAGDDPMLAIVRDFQTVAEDVHLFGDTRLLQASFAYSCQAEFALQVAYRDICQLKATVKGLAPVTRDINEAKGITKAYLHAIASISPE